MIFEKCKEILDSKLFKFTDEEVVAIVVNQFSFKEWLDELKRYTVLVEEIKLDKEDRSFWGYISLLLKECILYELEKNEVPTIRGER